MIVLAFLLLITWLGTEEQPEVGLHRAQEMYFKSWWVWHTFQWPVIGSFTLPIPGAMLLLTIFGINLICGGIVMMRKSVRTVGVMIAHVSMLFLLAGGLLQHQFASDGFLQLHEGEQSDEFVSFHDWVLRVHPVVDGKVDFDQEAYVVDTEALNSLKSVSERVVDPEGLPFDLKLSRYAPNASVMPAAFRRPADYPVVDGVFMRPLPLDTEQERNVPAVYVDVIDEQGETRQQSLLWGFENAPLTVQLGAQSWVLKLEKHRWKMAFSVALDKFTHEFYANTSKPKVYKSDVRKIENGNEENVVIEMNEPLRDEGFIVFQSGYGPQDASGRLIEGKRPYSVFAVWRNPRNTFLFIPVEHWPMVTVSIAAIGMALHFLLKLSRHLVPARRETPPNPSPSS